jgi:N-acetylneuraminate synthase
LGIQEELNKMGTLIIAEAGVNHNGDIRLAKKLIDAAADAGADYVKFQTFKAEKLVSKTAVKAAYQTENTGNAKESQLDMLKKLQLTEQDHYELIKYCEVRKIKFLSTAFDLDSLGFLKELGIRLFKIPSGEITNLPYLELVAQYADEIILSTGMCTMDEIEDAVRALKKLTQVKISVLHCNTEYPTPYKDVNLLAMLEIGRALNVEIGYSDHTLGIEVPVAAVALGAKIIEKHFTLDRTLPGPDHIASLEPDELKNMVTAIRNIELALGAAIKEPSPSEMKNKAIARKSIHLAANKTSGTVISAEDLEMLRPGDGISPMRMNDVIGKKVVFDLPAGHKLSLNDLSI